ncbi:MAG TPA: metallophosphoesterase [Stellaceae bacterium]|nr:metallophosphoesterase [Stellaceae bacterium]
MSFRTFSTGIGVGSRRSHVPPAGGAKLKTQSAHFVDPKYPFQPLPTPNGPAPYRYDLSQLLQAEDIKKITDTGVMVCHTVGDTGDYRGRQQDFVADMMVADADALAADKKPAFFYHLGDVVYFAGDIDKYGENFYETYKDYPAFIVAIPGNHDCQPDDPQDGPVDPHKVPLDGWVQNFMSRDPNQIGSLKTTSTRTQLDLPNVYWAFTTPLATFVGLFSNVGEIEGEIHQDQIDWFVGELKAADPDLALIVAVHHPPYSGDTEHTGSTAVHKVLTDAFAAAGRVPHLVLSGHVHNYQRFTVEETGPDGSVELPYIVAGAGGYTRLGKLQKVQGRYPTAPLDVEDGVRLEAYDHDNFGFLRLEITKKTITGTYLAAPYQVGRAPDAQEIDGFEVDLAARKVKTLS